MASDLGHLRKAYTCLVCFFRPSEESILTLSHWYTKPSTGPSAGAILTTRLGKGCVIIYVYDFLFFFFILKQNQQYIHANCKHTYTNSINDMI